MRIRVLSWAILIFLLSGSLFPFSSYGLRERKMKILTTILPLYIFTRNLTRGIEGVELELLIDGAKSDPHTYSLTIADVKKIAGSDLIIANGRAEESIDFSKIRAANLRAPILFTHDASVHGKGLPPVKDSNPHTWLSPKRASLECDSIGRFLMGAFPEESSLIRKNLEEYQKSLEILSGWISRMVLRNRLLRLITFHDALDIFAADYGLLAPIHVEEVHGVPPSMQKIVFLVKEASSHKGNTVIVSETPHPDPITRRISEMSGAPIVWFNPILQGEKEETLYEKMIEESVEKLLPSSTM